MFNQLFQSFEKLITEFSWRRLCFVLVFLFLSISAVWIWESYTWTMRLTRIERTISILKSIEALEASTTINKDVSLKETFRAAKEDLLASTHVGPDSFYLSKTWSKALAGAAPWLFLSLMFLPGLRKGDSSEINGLIGALFVAGLSGGIGAFLPSFRYPWLNYIAYPLGSITIIVLFVLWFQARKNRVRP